MKTNITINSFDFKKQGFNSVEEFKAYIHSNALEDQKITKLPLSFLKKELLKVLAENEPHTLK